MKKFLYSTIGKVLVIAIMLAAFTCTAVCAAWALSGLHMDMDYNVLSPTKYEESSEMVNQYLRPETESWITEQAVKQNYFKNGILDLNETVDISDLGAGIAKTAKNPDLTYSLGDLNAFYESAGFVYLSWILESRDSLVIYDAEPSADVQDTYGPAASPTEKMTLLYDNIIYDINEDIDPERDRNGDDRILLTCYPLLYNVLYNNGLPLEKKYILNTSGGTVAEYAQENLETVSILDSYTNLIRAAERAHELTQYQTSEASNAMIWMCHTESRQAYTNVDDWRSLQYDDVASAYGLYLGADGWDESTGVSIGYDGLTDTTSISAPASKNHYGTSQTEALQSLANIARADASEQIADGHWQIFVGFDTSYAANDRAKSYAELYHVFAEEESYGHHTLAAGIISAVIFIIMMILSVFQTGHRKEDAISRASNPDCQLPEFSLAKYPSRRIGVHTTAMERFPIELLIIMDIILWIILFAITFSLIDAAGASAYPIALGGGVDATKEVFGVSAYELLLKRLYLILIPAAIGFAILLCWNLKHYVRRIKARTLGASLIKSLYRAIRKVTISAYRTRKEGQRLVIVYILLVAVNAVIAGICGMLAVAAQSAVPVVVCIIVLVIGNIVILRKLMSYFSGRDAVRKGMDEIAAGNLDYKVDVEEISGYNREMAEGVNQVSAGLKRAVENEMKSERLKTELITNVSHDIKTPLTSIINYVDILKRHDIQDEDVRSYIEILDRKSARLKQLVEDLVESSKISSGNVSLEMHKIDFSQLILQMNGEFREKFAERNLSLVCSLPEEPMLINADGARLFRVIENLYNNAAKYALPGTRIYVDGTITQGFVTVTVRNVSEYPLNISAEELTERFVRGDLARTSEGSGLGLEIAKNLTVMQGGTFDIVLDGDLFKVVIAFPQAS